MLMTQNPFERGSHGKGKAETEKPNAAAGLRAALTGKPGGANADPDGIEDLRAKITGKRSGAKAEAAAPQKPRTTSNNLGVTIPNRTNAEADAPSLKSSVGGFGASGLPPTRKSQTGEKSAGPAAAGFQKPNPFNRTKPPQVSNSGPQPDKAVEWDPKKTPPAPGTQAAPPSSGASVQGAPPGSGVSVQAAPPAFGASVVATTAQGMEIVSPNSTSEDYGKQYAQKAGAAESALAEKIAGPVTVETYREHYQAEQQQRAAEQRAEQQQRAAEQRAEQEKKQQEKLANTGDAAGLKKNLDEAAANAHKARNLQAQMANLQTKLVPNMSPEEVYRIHGEIEEVRVALAQIPYYG